MKDELISYQLAKLAYAKGFKEPCDLNYYDIPEYEEIQYGHGKYHDDEYGTKTIPIQLGRLSPVHPGLPISAKYLAPTQALLQRWLREKHDIHCIVEVCTDEDGNTVFESNLRSDGFNDEEIDESESSECMFDTYEKALEDCLVEGLNCI